MLYFAYGSNLNIRHMNSRCPDADPIGKFTMNKSRLVFRHVADCVFDEQASCIGALWKITPACERRLDVVEGVAGGFYRKEFVDLDDAQAYEGEKRIMMYVMNSDGIFPPALAYLDTIRQGYKDFGIPLKQLEEAVTHSHDKQNPSHHERQRYARKGRPRLAPRPGSKELSYPTTTTTQSLRPEPRRIPLADHYDYGQESFEEWLHRQEDGMRHWREGRKPRIAINSTMTLNGLAERSKRGRKWVELQGDMVVIDNEIWERLTKHVYQLVES